MLSTYNRLFENLRTSGEEKKDENSPHTCSIARLFRYSGTSHKGKGLRVGGASREEGMDSAGRCPDTNAVPTGDPI